MSWSIGYDTRWKRDIGYGVPAWCDFPGCNAKIDRGLIYVCGGEPYGGEEGCGLYFCSEHHRFDDKNLCERCSQQIAPFAAKPDHPEWVHHKLTDDSWQIWRDENPDLVAKLSTTEEKSAG